MTIDAGQRFIYVHCMSIKHSIPNWLTYGRTLAVPVVIGTFYIPGDLGMQLTAVLFFLASLTDWLDGYLARLWHVQSAVGKFLDPIADKLLVVTCLVLLVGAERAAIIPSIAIILREILVSGLREFLAEIQVKVHVTTLAKYKTTVQMLAIFLLLLGSSAPDWLYTNISGQTLLWMAAALTLYTGFAYMKHGWVHMREMDGRHE